MAVGKSSLGRVANSTVLGAPSDEVTATVASAVTETPKKETKKETAAKTVAKGKAAVIYGVGDELPTYLL